MSDEETSEEIRMAQENGVELGAEEEITPQESRLYDLYNQVSEEAEERDKKEFGVLCCLMTPGLRKDIRRQIQQLYSHKVTYYRHYNYILSSDLLLHSRIFYFYY